MSNNRITSDVNPFIETKSLSDIADKSGNLYKSIVIVAQRATQISQDIKQELTGKLEEFASSVDNLEEIHENREQIEISKYYEKLPNPVRISLENFMDDKIYYRDRYAEIED